MQYGLYETLTDIGVELDARITKSGLVLVAHDNLLQNFTNGSGWVNEVTLEQLKTLQVRCGNELTNEGIPQLKEVFGLFAGRGKIYLEIKVGPGDYPEQLLKPVLQIIQQYPAQQVEISSFYHPLLFGIPNNIPIGILTNTTLLEPIDIYQHQFKTVSESRQIAYHPDIWNLNDKELRVAQDAGMQINAYTVPPHLFEWCYRNGVNLITDYPEEDFEFLAKQQNRR